MREWWGRIELETGRQRRWRLGPLRVRVARLHQEWQVGWTAGCDPLEDGYEIVDEPAEPIESEILWRYGAESTRALDDTPS